MDIKLLKTLTEELIEITEEMHQKAEDKSLADKEFLEFVKKIGEKNTLILEEIGTK